MVQNSFKQYANRMLYLLLFGVSSVAFADKKIETNDSFISDKKFEAGLKIRAVNPYETMGTCGDGLETRELLEKERDEVAMQLKQEEQDLMKDFNQFKVEATTMSDDARQSKEKELMRRKRDYDNHVKEAEEELKLTIQKKTESLAKEFEVVVNEYGREQGLDIIADKVTGRLIYVADDLDVTGDIIKKMDSKREVRIAAAKKRDAKPATAVAKSTPAKSKTAAA